MIIINFYHDSIWRRLMVAMYSYILMQYTGFGNFIATRDSYNIYELLRMYRCILCSHISRVSSCCGVLTNLIILHMCVKTEVLTHTISKFATQY